MSIYRFHTSGLGKVKNKTNQFYLKSKIKINTFDRQILSINDKIVIANMKNYSKSLTIFKYLL